MGSFARLAANALSEFIGGADDVATKGSDDLVATQVVKSDSSKTFGEGTQRVKYTDPKSNSFIEVVQRPKGAASVIGLEVPEKFRGLGIGQSLQEIAMKDNPDLMGQVSSKAAATTAYRLGRRPSTKSDATLEEVFSMIDKDSSVNMVTLKGSNDLVSTSVKANTTLATPKISNTDYTTKMKEFDNIEDISEWRNTVSDNVKTSRKVNPDIKTPELENSTRKLLDGNISREEHLKNIDEIKPVTSWDDLPREPSNKAVVFSLRKNQRDDGLFVLPSDELSKYGVSASALKVGDTFNGRLDIDAYKSYDSWIVAGKSSSSNKGSTHYLKAVHYKGAENKPVRFLASQKTSERIGTGEIGKTGYATISGIVKDLDANNIRVSATEYLDNPDWTQVGFDPRRQGGFFVRKGKNKHIPVREASEVIQIGPLVLAKNAILDKAHKGYNKGGIVKKGLMAR